MDITVANIYQSFTHKMAPKTSWQRYETKLSRCQSMYTVSQKKQDTKLLAITSLIIIRFSNFFH